MSKIFHVLSPQPFYLLSRVSVWIEPFVSEVIPLKEALRAIFLIEPDTEKILAASLTERH